jgi:predicted negative regulator of RcsB-dependent stress response
MSNSAPIDPKAPSNTAPATGETPAPVPHNFEEDLRLFWAKNSKAIYALCVVVLLAIIGVRGWEYWQQKQQEEIQQEFALASSPEKLKSFIAQHPGHQLAGVGSLKLADEAYSANNYTEAAAQYQKAAEILKDGPLGGRARLGQAMSKANLGQNSEAEDKLKQLANDASQLKAVRGEAAYHLATLSLAAGRNEDAAKYLEQVSTVDQAGFWAQRAMLLRSQLPVPAAAVTPSVSVPVPPKP